MSVKISYEKIILLVAFMMILLRFTFPGDTVFIADEPSFQSRIDQHLEAGTIPLTSFRGSSIALPYGGGAFWFYMPIRLLISDPVLIALYHIFFLSLGAILFWYVMRKQFGAEPAAWGFLLLASSPILFFFARHSWDNTLFVPLGAAILWLMAKLQSDHSLEGKKEYWVHAFLGLAAAYGLNIHLMFGPMIIAIGLTLLWRNASRYGIFSFRTYGLLATYSFIFILAVAPYLLESYRIVQQEAALESTKFKDRWGDLRNLWWLFQRTTVFTSVWGSRIYLEQVKQDFYLFSGGFLTFFYRIDIFGWIVKLAAWFSVIFAAIALIKKNSKVNILIILALFSFLSILSVYQYLNIPTAPHYFHPVWWFGFLGFAYTLSKSPKLMKPILLGFCAATVLVNFSFIVQSMRFFHENKGARAMSYSVAIHEQKRAISELCGLAKSKGIQKVHIDISQVYLMGFVFDYLPKHMDECNGLVIDTLKVANEPGFKFMHPADSNTKADLILSEREKN